MLPRATGLNEERLPANPTQPLAHVASDELWPIIRANVLWWPVRDEQLSEAVEYIVGSEVARHDDGQAASCKLVDHGKHAKASPVLGAVLHEVVGPHVIGPLRPQPDARAVVEPEPPALGL